MPNEYLRIHIPEPSFGGGGTEAEIGEAYDEFDKDVETAELLLTPFSFEVENAVSYNIYLNNINGIELIPYYN